ncbi:MAG: hypothetical protein ABIX01_18425 [Chitinophagaceae bacterium]
MTGIFKDRNTFQVIFLFVIAFLAKLAYILHPPLVTYMPGQGMLTDGLNNWYTHGGSKVLAAVLALVIILASGIYANAVLMSQRMFSKVNLLVALSMVLISSLVPEANVLSAPLVLLPLLIWIYQNLSALYHSQSPKSRLFNVGMGIGLGAIMFHPFIVMVAVGMFALASMRTFKLQEWLVMLLGLTAPYYFVLAWEFLAGNWHPVRHVPSFVFGYHHISCDTYSLLAYGMIVVWVTMGLYCWQENLRRMLIQARKNWNIILAFAMLSALMIFIRTGAETDAFALAVFPLGAFAASAFLYPKKAFVGTLLFWIIVFMIMVTCLRHYEGKI